MSFDFLLLNNDLSMSSDGKMKTVADTQKLRQDIIKILLTTLGANRFHPWYGSTVSSDIIGKNLPYNMIVLNIETSIRQSLERLQKLQLQQQTTQRVSLAELIHSIGPVSAYRNPDDLRQVKIDVTVYSRQLTPVKESFTLSLL